MKCKSCQQPLSLETRDHTVKIYGENITLSTPMHVCQDCNRTHMDMEQAKAVYNEALDIYYGKNK